MIVVKWWGMLTNQKYVSSVAQKNTVNPKTYQNFKGYFGYFAETNPPESGSFGDLLAHKRSAERVWQYYGDTAGCLSRQHPHIMGEDHDRHHARSNDTSP